MPSSGMLTECVELALKSRSSTVCPPSPFSIVRRGEPVVVRTWICVIRAGPTPNEPVPVIRFAWISELDMTHSLWMYHGIVGLCVHYSNNRYTSSCRCTVRNRQFKVGCASVCPLTCATTLSSNSLKTSTCASCKGV
jgi:hypothetical protein